MVFGLLGVNGAGKTTTFQLMSGLRTPSAGEVKILGMDVQTQVEACRRYIGYCPQFDPLIEQMTGRETLRMYAQLKSVPGHLVEQVVDSLLAKVGVLVHADKPCGTYSGGNKRKLSLAVSLVGRPSVVFLDEPSTGMDPVARRQMWEVIDDVKRTSSVVLTTHSMEECEALCSRIGIMVGGRFRCLGSGQHLKNKFGGGYHLELKTTGSVTSQAACDFIEDFAQGAVRREMHAGTVKYHLPKQNLTLSEMFETVEAKKDELQIEQYSISQFSLEQIFIALAKTQDEEKGEIDGVHGSGDKATTFPEESPVFSNVGLPSAFPETQIQNLTGNET